MCNNKQLSHDLCTRYDTPSQCCVCVCVCTLWTLALAHRKGQARKAAIICPCVMLGRLQLFGGGVVSLKRAFLVSTGRRAHGCGTFHPAGVENGASSAGARPAPQVWQCRWERQKACRKQQGSSRDRAAPLQLAKNNNSSALHERSDELIKVTTLTSSSLEWFGFYTFPGTWTDSKKDTFI